MAEGDNPSRFTNTGTLDEEIAGGTVKGNPITKNRLEVDGAAGTTPFGRSTFYASANQKDVLPEHTARRTTYPFINAR